jgi:hypothetical protein
MIERLNAGASERRSYSPVDARGWGRFQGYVDEPEPASTPRVSRIRTPIVAASRDRPAKPRPPRNAPIGGPSAQSDGA